MSRSDAKGQFKFEKLCPGTISLRLSHSAYVEHTLELEVPQDKSIEVLLSPLSEKIEPEEGKEVAPESQSKPETTPDRVEELETGTEEAIKTSAEKLQRKLSFSPTPETHRNPLCRQARGRRFDAHARKTPCGYIG